MSFNQLGLRAELLETVAANGYTEATPIQSQAIPLILQGRDVLGGSQTGTGKTAAFTLPLLQRLAETGGDQRRRNPRALLLTPTRELAAQVGESVATYGKGLALRSTIVFGGVGIHPQIGALQRGVDIVIATPGRLLDHANQETVDLSHIEVLILDEADRMLDMGFIHDIRRIMKLLPAQRQNLLFSATYSKEIRKLSDGILRDPALIEVARRNTAAEKVAQFVHPVAKSDKPALLIELIEKGDWNQVLVFTRTKHGANRLAKRLAGAGISSSAIHGNKSQSARTRALTGFKGGEVRVLVATDVASRGLDISRLPHVVNFELPNVPEDYVHRIGRTGRAGEEGAAHSLVSADERGLLRDIERLLERSIPVREIEGFRMHEADAKEDARRNGGGRGGRRAGGTHNSAGEGRNGSRNSFQRRSGSPAGRRRRRGAVSA